MKKGIIALLLLFGIMNSNLTAQEQQAQDAASKLQSGVTVSVDSTSNWKLSGITGVNVAQTALVNWSAGGENSVAGNFYLNGSLDYAKDKWAWDNDLVLEYGLIHSDQYDLRKNSDKISVTSKLGYQINTKWYYSLLADYNTQFAKGYDYGKSSDIYISTFMAPAYANLAIGIDYKPKANMSFFLSPISTRFLFVMDDSLSNAGAYGIDPGKTIKVEAGALFKGNVKKNIMENVDMISKLDVFTPYNEDFGKIDVNWEILLSFKINKLLTASLNTTIRYYDREITKVQFKEIFGLGVAYRF